MCSGLGGRTRHTLQDNLILQARVLTLEGGSNTLGINDTNLDGNSGEFQATVTLYEE